MAEDINSISPITQGASDTMLSSIYRDILFDIGLDIGRFQYLLEGYIVRSGMATTSNEISTARAAMHRELWGDTMTWAVFVKGLLFLRVERLEMKIRLERQSGQLSDHVLTAELRNEGNTEEQGTKALADLYRSIQVDLGIDDEEFQSLVDTYIKSVRIGGTPSEISTARSSLRRELKKARMSVKVLIKGLVVLKVERMFVRTILYHQSGKTTYHDKTINLAGR